VRVCMCVCVCVCVCAAACVHRYGCAYVIMYGPSCVASVDMYIICD
jgi:hypothetical protein